MCAYVRYDERQVRAVRVCVSLWVRAVSHVVCVVARRYELDFFFLDTSLLVRLLT